MTIVELLAKLLFLEHLWTTSFHSESECTEYWNERLSRDCYLFLQEINPLIFFQDFYWNEMTQLLGEKVQSNIVVNLFKKINAILKTLIDSGSSFMVHS